MTFNANVVAMREYLLAEVHLSTGAHILVVHVDELCNSAHSQHWVSYSNLGYLRLYPLVPPILGPRPLE
jgi:hypothetical protein